MSAPTIERPAAKVDFGDRSARRRRRIRAALLVLAVVLAGAAVWVVWFSSLLTVDSVRVVGAEGPLAQTVTETAGVPLGVPMARLDTGSAQSAVLALPWVSSVEVRRGWPHEVVLAVVARTPIAVVMTDGQRRAVDADGVVFESATALPRTMPTVTADGVGLEAAMAVLGSLPVDLVTRVAAISATTRDDVDLRLRGGATVHWGSAEQADFKAQVLNALMRRKADVYDVTAPELPTTFRAK